MNYLAFLNNKITNTLINALFIGFCIVLFWGCSSSQNTSKSTANTANGTTSAASENSVDETKALIEDASAVDWSMIKDDISTPNMMRSTMIAELSSSNIGENADNYIENRRGYRVQIDFTRDMNVADSLKNAFNYRVRQLPTIAYKAEAYVIYRPPYYRIRVGDFKDRLQALDYTKQLKKYYPSSWVVADDINTSLIPAKKNHSPSRTSGNSAPDSSNYRQN